jgi:polysaccharide biosynthesis/export protein
VFSSRRCSSQICARAAFICEASTSSSSALRLVIAPCSLSCRPNQAHALRGPCLGNSCRCGIKLFVRELLMFCSLLAALAGCASYRAFDYASEPDLRRVEYVIGPSDVIRINVWHMPDLSGDAKVRPDGTVTLPLVGDVPAAGRTPSGLRTEIESRLKSFVKDDSVQVSVAMAEVNSYQFTVSGYAEHPGLFNARQFLTVTEAVALAGGPSRYASLSKIVIIRPSSSGPRRIPIDLGAIYSGEHPEMNIVIVAGDTIHLP